MGLVAVTRCGLGNVQGIAREDEHTGYFRDEDQLVIFALIMVAIAITVWYFV